MTGKTTLRHGAALGALTALGLGAAAQAQPAPADADMMAQLRALQAQVQMLQARLEAQEQAQAARPLVAQRSASPVATAQPAAPVAVAASAASKATTIEWKGAPELSNADGYRFKVRGRLQYDVGRVGNPREALTGNFGFNSRVRRLRLGVEGWLPGDLQYKAEADFANSAVGYGDVILFWQPKGKPYQLGIGNYDTFQSLEQPSSSRHISFLERAQFVEAFDQTRRLGAWAGLADPKNDAWRINLGLFNDRIRPDNAAGAVQGSYGNDDILLAARAVYSPHVPVGRLHVGVNYQHRTFQTNDLQQTYQARPFSATTDVRFVSTGAIAARGDEQIGLEAAAVLGRFHLAGEAQRLKVSAILPGDGLSGRESTTGRRLSGDPVFHGWYAEAGVFLTGEHRGYAKGNWDRTKVLHPVSQGGIGAIQLNLRYDVLDLTDQVGTGAAGADLVNGGRQSGVLGSLIWQPIDYVRFTLQYSHARVVGGPRGQTVDPSGAPTDAAFSSSQVLMRGQFDF